MKVNANFNILLLLISIVSPISFFPQKSSNNIEQLGRFRSTNRERIRLWCLSRSSNKRDILMSKKTDLLNATFDPVIYAKPITTQNNRY